MTGCAKIRQVLQGWEKASGCPPLGVVLSQVNSHVEFYLESVKRLIRCTSEHHRDGVELVAGSFDS